MPPTNLYKDGGQLRYRCRMCGEEFTECTHVPSVHLALLAIVGHLDDPWPGGMPMPRLNEIHHHKDGTIGVADLLGGKLDATH